MSYSLFLIIPPSISYQSLILSLVHLSVYPFPLVYKTHPFHSHNPVCNWLEHQSITLDSVHFCLCQLSFYLNLHLKLKTLGSHGDGTIHKLKLHLCTCIEVCSITLLLCFATRSVPPIFIQQHSSDQWNGNWLSLESGCYWVLMVFKWRYNTYMSHKWINQSMNFPPLGYHSESEIHTL